MCTSDGESGENEDCVARVYKSLRAVRPAERGCCSIELAADTRWLACFGCSACSDMPIFGNSKSKMFDKLLKDKRIVADALCSTEAQECATASSGFRKRRERALRDVNDSHFWRELEGSCKVGFCFALLFHPSRVGAVCGGATSGPHAALDF